MKQKNENLTFFLLDSPEDMSTIKWACSQNLVKPIYFLPRR